MTAEEKKMLHKIFGRYHTESDKDWPNTTQIAFDIGWLTGLIIKLDKVDKTADRA